jgi:hypothetical protein
LQGVFDLVIVYKSTEILFHVDVVGVMFVIDHNVLHNTMLFVVPIDQCNHFFLIAIGFTLSQGIATPFLSCHVVH